MNVIHTYLHTYIVYAHTYIQIYINYAFMHMYIHTYRYKSTHVCMSVYVCICMYVCVCVCICLCVYVCMYVRSFPNTYNICLRGEMSYSKREGELSWVELSGGNCPTLVDVHHMELTRSTLRMRRPEPEPLLVDVINV